MKGSQIVDVPDQAGRVAVVTGGSAGVGLAVTRALAARGAEVVVASRRAAETGQAVRLDLASLRSVRAAADEIRAACPRIDLLILNAGVMAIPFERTEDGFERTLATNHLGHFALAGLLLDRMLDVPGARVVTVASNAHRRGAIDLDDLQLERGYRPGRAYDRSKLANLLFAYELDRRLRAAGAVVSSLAAHPGTVRSELWRTSSALEQAFISRRLRPLTFWLIQDPEQGALPLLRAATDPAARGGEYYGPDGAFGFTGRPVRIDSSAASRDAATARGLWEASERLTGVVYDFSGAGAGG